MIIGVSKEIKTAENRVGATPAGVDMLVRAGHRVLVEKGAGEGSGFSDQEYRQAGAEIVPTAADAWGAEMVLKVKEPIEPEFKFFREDLLLFTYLHLANPKLETLTRILMEKRVTAVAYETVESLNGELPLLEPMSEVAGRMSVQVAAHYLEKPSGRGKLLGGVPGVVPCTVAVIGVGTVGKNAVEMALGMGASVIAIDLRIDRLRHLSEIFSGNLVTLSSNPHSVAEAVKRADVVIGAVLVAGARAPHVVTREMVRSMRPGSVIVDVAIDQGGCIETSRPTTHTDPIYVEEGVIHYCVTNMPGAVPRTSTYALTNATLPYALRLANLGFVEAVKNDAALAKGVNVYKGNVTCEGVASAHGLECKPLEILLEVRG
ncbi:MAG: alanine dehydrogenase [Anaerolineae bacterium]|nr:alanine dehydrogenase [Anaerolineae bacterium]